MMVLSDVQQQPGSSPTPWRVWGLLGVRSVPDFLGRSGMLMPLDPAFFAAQGCIPTDPRPQCRWEAGELRKGIPHLAKPGL